MTTHLNAAVALASLLLLAALFGGQELTTPEPVAEIKGIVADETGAVIPQSEVVFKGELGAIVSHTSMDGSITVELRTGGYTVTITKSGFVTAKLVDFQINAPTPAAFRVVLKVDHTPSNGGMFDGVPTTTSELPRVISFENGGYSTCPDLEHAVVRSVGYVQAAETNLRRWSTTKVSPKRTPRPDTVHVQVRVEGERVFCAQAIDGPSNKQKDAVDAAMQWRFKKKRGEFKDDLMGTLTFQF
jgi:hypothetical protein